ncbi:MAG: prolipoprotein diacylglyceryl transferase [Pseudomonadota bacterium]|nr:prolipoprotein diacylglyceryl transferase [Gammaproteobacteria bacterium]MBU1926844.1 prolipoprotein diacylglyceryl transferase [Gammaproteobacteria bacterium]MBU2546159.1 prolipoprotein diacylglyceryl transferase [Gammaproteobacteria bacterium]
MLRYPTFEPIAFHLGPLSVHWYGLMYLFSFIVCWGLLKHRARLSEGRWTMDQIGDLVLYAAFGVILGGRTGYMLFYDLHNFLHAPWIIVKVWEGGMSFHGGLLGVLIAVALWARKFHRSFFDVTDFLAPVVPVGLAAGRVGNFINCDFLGRVTSVPWGMIYPRGGILPRHPSTVYEFLLEGVLLFVVLWLYSAKPRPRMAVSGMFLLGYGAFRVFCEFFRQPDPQLGFLAGGWLTMGELLSIPMILGGILLLVLAYRYKARE